VRRDCWRSAVAVGLAVYLAASPGFAAAALPAIGTAVTPGAFRLNHATVRSNATLFEGAMVETGTASARMDLANGTQLELEPESTGRVFGGHLVLERGATRIDKARGFATESATGSGSAFVVAARGLTIQSDGNATAGRIALIGASRVEVAALTGSFRVLNSRGVLVAKIAAGKALALEPQPMPGPARVTGRLVRRGGDYLLTDETTNVTMKVNGSGLTQADLKRALGQRVEVTGSAHPGTTPVPGAAQVIEVAQVAPAPPVPGSVPGDSAPAGSGGAGGTAPAGAGGPAAGAGGGAASGAAVSVTMIAIIGGVAAAAVVGGLAASGKLGGSTAAPVSR
jgi:hypothetical protein